MPRTGSIIGCTADLLINVSMESKVQSKNYACLLAGTKRDRINEETIKKNYVNYVN